MTDAILQESINNGIFAMLTVGLLFYVLKENKARETNLFLMLEKQINKLEEITKILQDLTHRVDDLEEHIKDKDR